MKYLERKFKTNREIGRKMNRARISKVGILEFFSVLSGEFYIYGFKWSFVAQIAGRLSPTEGCPM